MQILLAMGCATTSLSVCQLLLPVSAATRAECTGSSNDGLTTSVGLVVVTGAEVRLGPKAPGALYMLAIRESNMGYAKTGASHHPRVQVQKLCITL